MAAALLLGLGKPSSTFNVLDNYTYLSPADPLVWILVYCKQKNSDSTFNFQNTESFFCFHPVPTIAYENYNMYEIDLCSQLN